jgi:2-C-methyl-D-erythritol 2,4-cyclodiphosphate synthase
MFRIGYGYDIHRLTEGRPLILGGIDIPYSLGLMGHSDADVLIHAVCDALLGAAALGDIGDLYPDTDPSLKDIYSVALLEKVVNILVEKNLRISNIDVVVFAEKPKLSKFKDQIRIKLSEVLGIDLHSIGLKATTTEGLGPIGRGEGIAAACVALVTQKNDKDT